MTKPQRPIKIKHEAGCVTNHDFEAQFRKMKMFYVDIYVMGETMTRKMVMIEIDGVLRYVDIVTGTIYDIRTGRCNSNKVWIKEVFRPFPLIGG